MADSMQELECKVEDGVLTIRIGVDILKNAAMRSPDQRLCWHDDETGKFMCYGITYAAGFAQDVVNEMNAEEEDGTTPLHRFLDDMFDKAISEGSLHITEEPIESPIQ